MTTKKTKEDLEMLIDNYLDFTDSTITSLSKPGQVFSAIAHSNYPDQSFDFLVEEIGEKDEESARSIEEKGIVFYVLGKKDTTRYSKFPNELDICIDTEVWYESISESERYWAGDTERNEIVFNAIENFEKALILEIKNQLEEWGLSVTQVYEWFGEDE